MCWGRASPPALSAASSPLFAAFFPAFSRQVASGNERKLADLYHRGSQLMSVLVLPAALTVIFFAKPLIFAWTGKESVADQTALIAALLTAGSAFGCIVTIPYALQLAYGWTQPRLLVKRVRALRKHPASLDTDQTLWRCRRRRRLADRQPQLSSRPT